ncbi:MAG: hypothetical protein A3E57_03530 [Candidatus Muproteobacteria bacterium RIFCSPHIGHO2_12_FULL_60_33]|uniref:Uncharacterized protein n=1 Tax=Candidatus Muproteobacteria bacterium RIFCSPLOWO2_01_FULL_60_18 TaxID=1817768 RepID=A0A1F6TWZ0_9PROT|nr:MAG: hypothetical protein A3A87_01905 [Candidatus Muproteobacteria bacterium RIFCSPLOWO2_01_FULL_60_18]OGI53288.1 MAG: hypothetical protein A2W42_03445 [Candidatus Muproteobacteria bacterium RIFCSPHIGHO2_01_60_12]OGI54203.1 MAG: hypothetical protein A3E57_03530 [Candidatus Muproteobacteria bacterium RIFCSPHIGHO2_12_FULL_60_33]OGI55038.1 MAG: hypothetical protein A3D32_03200 [Candidatus Muproteobacteria bacterium RIFCSPHIGHO2_02_FULL_60_13]OGI58669.1 MAG: hypothetical protein A2809_03150 [Can
MQTQMDADFLKNQDKFLSAFMLAPSMALALAYARAGVAALRCPIFAPGKIVRVHLRFQNII